MTMVFYLWSKKIDEDAVCPENDLQYELRYHSNLIVTIWPKQNKHL